MTALSDRANIVHPVVGVRLVEQIKVTFNTGVRSHYPLLPCLMFFIMNFKTVSTCEKSVLITVIFHIFSFQNENYYILLTYVLFYKMDRPKLIK